MSIIYLKKKPEKWAPHSPLQQAVLLILFQKEVGPMPIGLQHCDSSNSMTAQQR